MTYDATEIRERLRWLVNLRWIACIGVLLSTHVVREIAHLAFPLLPVYAILGFIAAYNAWFQLKLRDFSTDLHRNILEQIGLDYLALGAAVYFSGCYDSPFMYYFVLHIGISGILLPKRWVYWIALCGTGLPTLIMLMAHFGVLPYFAIFRSAPVSTSNLIVIGAYGTVFASMMVFTAYFVSYLAEKLNDKQKSLTRVYQLAERLRSTILMKDVMNILIDEVGSLENVRHVAYMHPDKENFSLVHSVEPDPAGGQASPEFTIPLTEKNAFTDTFMSCVACILDCRSLQDGHEKAFVESFFPTAQEIVVLPVWSSFQTTCYEHFCCRYTECPAHIFKDVRCWTVEDTMCRGRGVSSVAGKLQDCMQCDMFMPVGLFICDVTRSTKHSRPVDLEALIGVLDAASLAISNARLYERTLELSEMDGLTGIRNRRTFFKSLDTEFARVKRYIKKFAIIMLDIDNFKHYNDLHGHPQGDTLLRMLTATLKNNLRETDISGRYGGEEFIVLLPETDREESLVLAERLRSAVERENFPLAESQPGGRLTISLGVSCYPVDGDTTEKLVQAADNALYAAKRSGRNRVMAADPSRSPATGIDPAPGHTSL